MRVMLPHHATGVAIEVAPAEAATLVRDGSPPVTTNHPSDVPCPLPRRIVLEALKPTSFTRQALQSRESIAEQRPIGSIPNC